MRLKITIWFLLFILTPLLTAQSVNVEYHKKTRNLTGEEVINRLLKTNNYSILDNTRFVDGNIVGYTYYDYLSNGADGQKIIRFDDGTLMVGEMAALDSTQATFTRGTFYNYFDGNSWIDTSLIWKRVEPTRSGWGNIGAFEDKTAIIVSHVGLKISRNSGSPEAPVWNTSVIPNSSEYTWPKHVLATSGTNHNVYVTGGATYGGPIPFFRSTDGGATWDIQNKKLADTLSPIFSDYLAVTADDYMIDARGSLVSVVSAPTSGNVMLYHSTDQGTTFTTTTVYDAATLDKSLDQIPFDTSFFPGVDFKMCGIAYPDGTCDVLIDANNVTHIAWGTTELGYYINTDESGEVVRGSNGELQRSFFITDYTPNSGIMYWNSAIIGEPVPAAVPNSDILGPSLFYHRRGLNGFYPFTYINGIDQGLMGQPNMAFDSGGNIYMVFCSFKEGDIIQLDPADTISFSPFAHAYVIASSNMGATWTIPADIYPGSMGQDVNFPAIVNNAGDNLDILIQNDQSPGTWYQNFSLPQNRNAIIHVNAGKPFFSNANVTVTFPNEAENCEVGLSYNINWNSSNVNNVKIEYTTDSGLSWNNIVNSIPNNGTYTWPVPNTPSTKCKVKITDIINGSVTDKSNDFFSIVKSPLDVTSEIVEEDYNLSQNYPNPFNPYTKIKYNLKAGGFVTLKIFNMIGKEVSTLVNQNQERGNHEIDFNSADYPSGVYFYRIQAGSFVESKKMILMK